MHPHIPDAPVNPSQEPVRVERLPCTATVEAPELPHAGVNEPQLVMFFTGGDTIVIVYFMENLAYAITDPHAVAVGPQVSLRYHPHSESGAAAAGVTLRKLVYRFEGRTAPKHAFSLRAMKPTIARTGVPASDAP